MKFYAEVKTLVHKTNENGLSYFILYNSERNGGILAFLPHEEKNVLKDRLLSDEWKGCVFEIEYYSYKSKQGDYKSCFRIIDLLPCFPLGD